MALTEERDSFPENDHHCGGDIAKRRNQKRKWWLAHHETGNSSMIQMCPKDREKFPYYNFLLGARLLHSKWREPRTHLSGCKMPPSSFPPILDWFRIFLSHSSTSSFFNVTSVRYFFILFLFLNCLSLPILSVAAQDNSTSTITPSYNQTSSPDYICPSMDIRNNAESFRQLDDCIMIEGSLQIVLMDKTNESDFTGLSFPKLREITGYLLLYRVNGLKTLANIFPNLAVIRGVDLFDNYALAVYEMLHLQELGLHSLTDIARGYVFITKNPLLCYIDTIDWSRIINPNSSIASNFIVENRAANACPRCPPNFENSNFCGYNDHSQEYYCWSAEHCQRSCPGCSRSRCTKDGECCSSQCLGGCYAKGDNRCIACDKVKWNHSCLAECPTGFYESTDRTCITAQECRETPAPTDVIPPLRPFPYKPFQGKCIIECPTGYVEELVDKNYTCSKCSGPCRKVCDGTSVDSIQSAQRLKGCIVINGSLEIQIRGAGIVRELEENLNTIEEVTGYLKVVRSLSVVSLNFLRGLKLIKGEILENHKYAIVVLDNQNLMELWDFTRRESTIAIQHGRIFFHFNPKLCLSKIYDLQKVLNLTDVTELEVAPNSNGDKIACNLSKLYVSIATLRHDMVIITWKPYSHYEMRTLLGYVVYYMEAPGVNISITDNRDGCGNDGWNAIDVEIPETANLSMLKENMTTLIPHLKPYTRYAYYVKTYTIATETSGAQSDVHYFRTSPSTPSDPSIARVLPISDSEVRVQWLPPEFPNGVIQYYVVRGTLKKEEMETKDFCKEPPNYEKKLSNSFREERMKYLPFRSSERRKDCSCGQSSADLPDLTRRLTMRKSDDEVQALIEFENKLQNVIYIKYNRRRRRDISHYAEHGGNLLENLMYSDEGGNKTEEGAFAQETNPETNLTAIEPDSGNYTTETSFRFEVSNYTLDLLISDLKHFTYYDIFVSACREMVPNEGTGGPSLCSAGRQEIVRTLPLDTADLIDPTSISLDANETNSVILKWSKPNQTNGEILTYLIQYKRVDVDDQQPFTQCILSAEFEQNGRTYLLKKLSPGNYSVMVRATSLASDTGAFSPEIYFQIKNAEVEDIDRIWWGVAIAFLFILVALATLFCTVRVFYPQSWYHRKLLFATVNPEYFKPVEGYDKWEISRRKIIFDKLLGIGHFGEVYEGRAKGIIQKGVTTKVAIKTLNKSPTNQRTYLNFLNEASVMKQFDTHHVVRLLGVVTKGEPLVIMELMAKGDLRTFLRSCRQDVPEEERKGPVQDPPTLQEILQMAAEIADGMLYLADKKFVHRDLAARNCMINAEGTVKIGDFGLTRDVYETDYYRKDSRGHLPVRWMAPESLRDGIFTSRSDVWSYGVVLWEMATLASLPYTGLGNGEVMPFVINGGVMEEPEGCPAILREIMKNCWQYKYSQRPMFSEILETLLPNVREDFASVSYYHTEDSRQLRASAAEAAADEDTPYTPLRTMEDFENFSLDSEEEEEERDLDHREPMLSHEGNSSSANNSVRSLPTVNGYIQRPLNLIPLVNTKTTPC